MIELLFDGIIILFISSIPYIIYLYGIRFGKKLDDIPFPEVYPNISIIISAYNEELVIKERILNLEQCNYPKELIEIIFVDDKSSDDTYLKAKYYLEKTNIPFRIISNDTRMGTNRSYNNAMKMAKYPIIVTTDADVFFDPDALNHLIGRLISDEKIAAVTGELQPRIDANMTTRLEETYRSFYGRMCDWESDIDSTYNFNGALVAFRGNLIKRIDDKRGADDANTAFEAIRQGYKAVYEKRALIYEDIPMTFKQQYRQKIRRATQLIEATIANFDLLTKKRAFSKYIYPMRIFMYLATPFLFFLSIILIGLYSNLLLSISLLFIIIVSYIWRQNIFVTFVVNQFYLLMGLVNICRDTRVWESTSKKVK